MINIMKNNRQFVLIAAIIACTTRSLAAAPIEVSDLARRLDAIKQPSQLTKWQKIPWMLDLNEAIRVAKDEKRPILIWVSGDDPLERC
jgi:hypothetical protein